MRETYRPALVPAGHAIMHGKFVFSQSRSTFLSLSRSSMMARRWCHDRYLASVNSTVALPETVTGLDWIFMPSCHAETV